MLIEQIPTSSSSSSSSSDADAESGDRETSFQAQVENPSPSSQLPPQTSAAAPPPAVNEETLRHLDKILRIILSDMDNASTYAALKAKLGISRFKEPASPSKTKIPPNSPTSLSPSPIQPSPSPIAQPSPPSPTFTPIQPMKYGREAADEEGWGEDYGQPFAIPSPTSSGGSTSIHEPHLTGGGKINDEEEEDLDPLFDYREAEKEEEPPRRQTCRMTMDRLLEEAETLKTRGEEETVMQRPRTVRRLVDEEEPEEPKSQEAVKEKEAKEDSRQRGERKRKGKGSVFPL